MIIDFLYRKGTGVITLYFVNMPSQKNCNFIQSIQRAAKLLSEICGDHSSIPLSASHLL
jgi:hypothetical protein